MDDFWEYDMVTYCHGRCDGNYTWFHAITYLARRSQKSSMVLFSDLFDINFSVLFGSVSSLPRTVVIRLRILDIPEII